MGFIDFLKQAVPTTFPSAGKVRFFVDSTTGKPRYIDETGTVGDFTGSTGATGATGPTGPAAPARGGVVYLADYGADFTGTTAADTALDSAIAALPAGGDVVLAPGTVRLARAPYVVAANNVRLIGAGYNSTTLKTTATTGDQIRFTGYGCRIAMINIQGPGTGTTSQKTAGIGVDMQSVEGSIDDCSFSYQYDALAISGNLVDVNDVFCRYFTHTGIVVNHNSDHRITRVTMNNATATLPTGSGIDVQVTASLILERLNVINSNLALNVSPANGVTVPSIKAVDCFFDTSAVGLNMTGAGSVFRSQFTNCWFSSMTTAGVRLQPASGGTVDGVTFTNCDMYNNVAGTTTGVLAHGGAGSVGKWRMVGCTVAGWTVGVQLNPGTNHYPSVVGCTIGSVSAFGVNGTGIVVATGTYKGVVINSNDVVDNTAALTLGAVTVTAWAQYRIIDNAGINPRGTVTTPAVPATTVAVTNTTGLRVTAYIKGGVTSVVTVNGVATPSVLAAGNNLPVQLDPGGTIATTFTTAPTWVWVAN